MQKEVRRSYCHAVLWPILYVRKFKLFLLQALSTIRGTRPPSPREVNSRGSSPAVGRFAPSGLPSLFPRLIEMIQPTFPVYRKFYGGFIRKTRSESPRHAKILATKDFVPKPEGKSFKTAWIHKSTFFKEIPLVRPNVPSNQEKALCEPGKKYPTQIPKPRECRL